MGIFYVFQGETYSEERSGGYVWSPQKDKAGHENAGYKTMTNIKKGDFILHNENGKLVSISIAKNDCYESAQPLGLIESSTKMVWDKDKGYRVDLDYFDFDVPLLVTNYREWLGEHYIEKSAFNKLGRGKQQYMCNLAEEHAIFLLEKSILLQKDEEVLYKLSDALSDIVGEKESEYSQVEVEEINEIVDDIKSSVKAEWTYIQEKQEIIKSHNTGREIPKRNVERAAKALQRAEYKCEYDNKDRTFIRKNGKPYTEPHHLIPISKYRDFKNSLDIMENIISLCSNCHNLLHYGRIEDKLPLLKKLYNERKDALHKCGIDLTFEQLIKYYM